MQLMEVSNRTALTVHIAVHVRVGRFFDKPKKNRFFFKTDSTDFALSKKPQNRKPKKIGIRKKKSVILKQSGSKIIVAKRVKHRVIKRITRWNNLFRRRTSANFAVRRQVDALRAMSHGRRT